MHRDGNALKGGQSNTYVDNVFDLLDETPTIKLVPDTEDMTLACVKHLAHDRPATDAPDLKSLPAGIEGPHQPLICSLF